MNRVFCRHQRLILMGWKKILLGDQISWFEVQKRRITNKVIVGGKESELTVPFNSAKEKRFANVWTILNC